MLVLKKPNRVYLYFAKNITTQLRFSVFFFLFFIQVLFNTVVNTRVKPPSRVAKIKAALGVLRMFTVAPTSKAA